MSNEFINRDSDFSVGVTEIDTQHQELLGLVNELIDHSQKKQMGGTIYFKKIIDAVINHVTHHFASEEMILSKTDYGNFPDHKMEHDKLIQKIIFIRSEFGNEKGDMALFNLTVALKEYFLSHVLLYDKDAGKFFAEGVKNLRVEEYS